MPSVTGKVYNHSKRMKEKRAVLDGVAAELRRIIGSWPAANRTASGRLINANPAIAECESPVSAKLAGLFLLKHRETRHLAADALAPGSVAY